MIHTAIFQYVELKRHVESDKLNQNPFTYFYLLGMSMEYFNTFYGNKEKITQIHLFLTKKKRNSDKKRSQKRSKFTVAIADSIRH